MVYDIIYESGVIEVIVYKDGKEIGRDKIEIIGEFLVLKLVFDREVMFFFYGNLCYIKIMVVDKNGREVVFVDNRIVVEIEGVGEFVVLGSSNFLLIELFVS